MTFTFWCGFRDGHTTNEINRCFVIERQEAQKTKTQQSHRREQLGQHGCFKYMANQTSFMELNWSKAQK